MKEQSGKCNFTTSIAETLECSKKPLFDHNGFATHPCPEYDNPADCENYQRMDKETVVEHSPTPWFAEDFGHWILIRHKADFRILARLARHHKDAKANAEFIIKAANNYKDLVKLLKQISDDYSEGVQSPLCSSVNGNGNPNEWLIWVGIAQAILARIGE